MLGFLPRRRGGAELLGLLVRPGQAEGPLLARLWHAYQARGVRFAGVDVSDTRAAAAAFERRYGIGYPSLSDPSASIELAFGRVIPPALPGTLVLDRSDGIEARVIGRVIYPGMKEPPPSCSRRSAPTPRCRR